MERTIESLSMIVAHFGINSLIRVPGTLVVIARNGPPVGRPGLGSHVSNWLGAPHNHKSMQCFCFFLASSANAGSEKSPAKLESDTAPAPASPFRNMRRCSVCSGGEQWPVARLDFLSLMVYLLCNCTAGFQPASFRNVPAGSRR